jgi:hypothetical protein
MFQNQWLDANIIQQFQWFTRQNTHHLAKNYASEQIADIFLCFFNKFTHIYRVMRPRWYILNASSD